MSQDLTQFRENAPPLGQFFASLLGLHLPGFLSRQMASVKERKPHPQLYWHRAKNLASWHLAWNLAPLRSSFLWQSLRLSSQSCQKGGGGGDAIGGGFGAGGSLGAS